MENNNGFPTLSECVEIAKNTDKLTDEQRKIILDRIDVEESVKERLEASNFEY